MFHNILWRCAWDVGGICWLRVEFAGKWILKISQLGFAEKMSHVVSSKVIFYLQATNLRNIIQYNILLLQSQTDRCKS